MKRMFTLVYFLFAALFLVGCAAANKSQSSSRDTALGELPAAFLGELPCADCAGIRYRLNLFPDRVYTLESVYLGQGENRRFHEQGQWSLDRQGEMLTLEGDRDGPRMWRVRDAQSLEMLDLEGHAIDSDLNYTLKRTGGVVGEPLENSYWKLTQLDGNTVAVQDNQREAHLVLHADQSRVAGSTGCNRLMGSYQLDDKRLTFGEMASTRMACTNGMATEQGFLAALEKTATWRVLGQYLELYDAEGGRLARFQAVHMN